MLRDMSEVAAQCELKQVWRMPSPDGNGMYEPGR